MPRVFTDVYKRNHVELCQRLLDRYEDEGEGLLERIAAAAEAWDRHCEPEPKDRISTGNSRNHQQKIKKILVSTFYR